MYTFYVRQKLLQVSKNRSCGSERSWRHMQQKWEGFETPAMTLWLFWEKFCCTVLKKKTCSNFRVIRLQASVTQVRTLRTSTKVARYSKGSFMNVVHQQTRSSHNQWDAPSSRSLMTLLAQTLSHQTIPSQAVWWYLLLALGLQNVLFLSTFGLLCAVLLQVFQLGSSWGVGLTNAGIIPTLR